MFNNALSEMRIYEFTKDVTVYYGKFADGKGYHILVPHDVKTSEILRFVHPSVGLR